LWDGDTGERMHTLDSAGEPTALDGVVLAQPFVVRP
jgi:hypothetical protein